MTTQFDKFKQDISACNSPMELIGLIDGLTVSAALFCKGEYPDEVIFENGKLEEITIYGKELYLKSELSTEKIESFNIGDRVKRWNGRAKRDKGTVTSNVGVGYVVLWDDGTSCRIQDGTLKALKGN